MMPFHLGCVVRIFRLGATYSFQIGCEIPLSRLGITDRENSYLTPWILSLKCLRPREQLTQSGINRIDNFLDGHVWVHELKIKNDAVIPVNRNALQAYGVLMRVASESLDDGTMDPCFAQVQHALA